MTDPRMLNYYTTAAWLRGFVSSFDKENKYNDAIINRLTLAAELLDEVWDQYAKKEGL